MVQKQNYFMEEYCDLFGNKIYIIKDRFGTAIFFTVVRLPVLFFFISAIKKLIL